MENTLENKAKLFAQYWGQKVLKNKGFHPDGIAIKVNNKSNYSNNYLELTPLHLITDKDAIELSKYCVHRSQLQSENFARKTYFEKWKETDDYEWIQYVKSFCVNTVHYDEFTIDGWGYLRSKDYALPYNGLSVSEQVERGWVFLKTKI